MKITPYDLHPDALPYVMALAQAHWDAARRDDSTGTAAPIHFDQALARALVEFGNASNLVRLTRGAADGHVPTLPGLTISVNTKGVHVSGS